MVNEISDTHEIKSTYNLDSLINIKVQISLTWNNKMVGRINRLHKKLILITSVLMIAIFIALVFYFKPTKSLRARWDFYLDVSSHLADALNKEFGENNAYPNPKNKGYCNAMDLIESGLRLEKTFEKSAQNTGRNIKFKGDPVDPFRRKALFKDEKQISARYQHSASAEFGARVKGYPLRYYCSRNSKWAILLSNSPDEDIDIDEQFLLNLDKENLTIDTVEALIAPRTFNFTETLNDPSLQDNKGPFSSGDFALLLWEGKAYRIRR